MKTVSWQQLLSEKQSYQSLWRRKLMAAGESGSVAAKWRAAAW